MKKRHADKKQQQTSRRLRQFRLFLLIGIVAGIIVYRNPLIGFVEAWIPVDATKASVPTAGVIIPSEEELSTVRKGVLYLLNGKQLSAVKADGSLLWKKELKEPVVSVMPSYDGVFVKTEKSNKLLRYSSIGKMMSEISVPGSFTVLYETSKGILFEDRELRQYIWTDVSGGVLGTQQLPEEQILKTVVDPESGDAAIGTLKADGATLESALQRYDASGRLIGARTFKDAVLLDMQFLDSQLVVVLDDRIISLDQQMEDHWLVKEPARYQGSSFGDKCFWINRVQEDQILQCYNKDGKVMTSLPLKETMTLMETGSENQVAVVTGQRVRVYSENGDLKSDMTLHKVPLKVHWLSSKQLLIFYGDSAGIENIAAREKL